MNVLVAVLAVASAALVAGCAPAESRVAHSPDASTIAASTIGVLQCDDYLGRVNACLQRAPAGNARDRLIAESRQLLATWKAAAAHPQHRFTLPQACGVMLELAQEELRPLGCVP